MSKLFRRFWADKSGATAIEYGLIATLVCVSIIAGINMVGNGVSSTFSYIATNALGPGTLGK